MKRTDNKVNWNLIAWETYYRISSDINNKSTCSEGYWISNKELKLLLNEVITDLGYSIDEAIVSSILDRHLDDISGLTIKRNIRKRILPNIDKPKYWRGWIFNNTTNY